MILRSHSSSGRAIACVVPWVKLIGITWIVLVLIAVALVRPAGAQTSPWSASQVTESLETDEFRAQDVAAVSAWSQSLHLADWLGPLAPVALSPFFGIACLSGLSIWGPDWVANNALLGATGPLKNSTLFYVFVGLTLLTSVPRLTKVSKPFAQAVDQLETYSVIVILLVIKVVASFREEFNSDAAAMPVAVIQMGLFSVTADVLLAIAMVINVLVINGVKFFFEFLAWITPFPAIDAVFEISNKSLCAALMVLYAFSPMLATIVNLAFLLAALLVMRWIGRRVHFYRTVVLDPILVRLWPSYGVFRRPELIVFPQQTLASFAPKSRLRMSPHASGEGWELCEACWWRPRRSMKLESSLKPRLRNGWFMHRIVWEDEQGTEVVCLLSRRFDADLSNIASQLRITLESTHESTHESQTQTALAGEFQ